MDSLLHVFKTEYEKLKRKDKEKILALYGAESDGTLIEICIAPSSEDEEWYLARYIPSFNFIVLSIF